MTFHIEYPRVIPARRPEGHEPPAPKFSVRWPHPVAAFVSDYFGLQGKDLSWDEQLAFFEAARRSFAEADGPQAHEIMRMKNDDGLVDAVIVAYWTDPVAQARWEVSSSLVKWFKSADRCTGSRGVWREKMVVPYDRHETIYSGPWYRIGLSRIEGSEIASITTNGYFGAARDRVPLSAIDPLESPVEALLAQPFERLESSGRRLRVAVPINVVALRSGQYWAHATGEQLDDYVNNMRPRLMRGMDHLSQNKAETGTLSLRILTNLDDDGTERRETSTYAHFASMEPLETWALSHETHKAIYGHAIDMIRKHKQDRQLITWHELFVLPQAEFEYVNCHPDTGLLERLPACEVVSNP